MFVEAFLSLILVGVLFYLVNIKITARDSKNATTTSIPTTLSKPLQEDAYFNPNMTIDPTTLTPTTLVPTRSNFTTSAPVDLNGSNAWFTRDLYEKIAGSKSGYFSYENFMAAWKDVPEFCKNYDVNVSKRELAAFFANVYMETSFENTTQFCPPDYKQTCDKTKGYESTSFGRGPLQITGPNYEFISKLLFNDSRLASKPSQLATDPVIGWKASMLWWNVKLSKHAKDPFDFPKIVWFQNCGECFKARAGDYANGLKRVNFFRSYCKILGITAPADDKLICNGPQSSDPC